MVKVLSEQGAQSGFWTNPSVQALASGGDPISGVAEKAKDLVFRAVENGWNGPPFDPFWLAQFCGLEILPRDDIPDARLVAPGKGKAIIEYNPNQPRSRIRFSVAHEIGHTLFPDYQQTTRNRMKLLESRPDEWQLELLCNLAAAEMLMPSGSITKEMVGGFSIEKLMALWREYEVSPEALLIRTARSTNQPISVFAAARAGDETTPSYRVDYCIPSRSSQIQIAPGTMIPDASLLQDCTAIGYTAKGKVRWWGTELNLQCVGIPPYPRRIFPRVVGFLSAREGAAPEPLEVLYVRGDVTQPRGEGSKIISHIVNDKASTWGAGAARAIGDRWPSAHSDFRNWTMARREEFELGTVHEFDVTDSLAVVSMVAQHGYGESLKPRIRYAALRDCLSRLSEVAVRRQASVHMPKIGTGFAGGNWTVIEDLIVEALISRGIKVVVYELPRTRDASQTFLDSTLSS